MLKDYEVTTLSANEQLSFIYMLSNGTDGIDGIEGIEGIDGTGGTGGIGGIDGFRVPDSSRTHHMSSEHVTCTGSKCNIIPPLKFLLLQERPIGIQVE